MSRKIRQAIINRSFKGLILSFVLFGTLFGFSLLQENEISQSAFIRSAAFGILIAFGYTLKKLFDDIRSTEAGRRYHPAGTAAGLLIAGLGLWQSLVSFNMFRVWPGKFALIALCGLVGYSLSITAVYVKEHKTGLIAGAATWLAGAPVLKFMMGILIGLYLVYFRPHMADLMTSLILCEFIALSVLTFGILLRVGMNLTKKNPGESIGRKWKQHNPPMQPLTGDVHRQMLLAERQFIERGDPVGLCVLLTVLMHENGVRDNEIRTVVRPLIQSEETGNVSRKGTSGQRKKTLNRQSLIDGIYETIEELLIVRRAGSLPKDRKSLPGLRNQETIPELKRRFIDRTDTSGLLVYLIVTMHHDGRRQEYICWTLRGLFDTDKSPSDEELQELLSKMNGTPVAGETNRLVKETGGKYE